MATFGTQSSDEDHPIRAVFAAIKILQAVENFQGALLFRAESRHQTDLDNQNISQELRGEFAANDMSLSDDVTISIQQKGRRWLIADRGTHQTYSVWRVWQSDDECLVYRGAKIHIGINSGPAWVGKLAVGEFPQTTVIGNTVNLSARLKTKAELNQIIVSPTTYELTKDFFVYDPLAAVPLKGIPNPVPIFALKDKSPLLEQKITIFESQADRQSQTPQNRVEAIPPHLRDKINAAKRTIKGERKMVTMLYSDLSGFTELSEKFKSEPEKIAKLMEMCHDELGKVVYEYEGIIDQIVGDELMAIFGVPITHEDDPERAVLAGLEMLSEIKRFSEKMGREMGMPPLNVHIGINTGQIAIGDISSDDDDAKLDYTAIGEPVELAETLEDIGEAGDILVGERTYRMTLELFDYKKKTDVEVGGKKTPVYRVLGKKAAPGDKRGVSALNDVFVAREEEFDTLKETVSHLFKPIFGKYRKPCYD